MDLSIVIPIYNEEGSLPTLFDEIKTVLKVSQKNNLKWECLFVDDGSKDSSWTKMLELAASDSRFKFIKFRRNFGQTAALAAGIRGSSGDWIATLDGDMQNDPKDIISMLKVWEDNNENSYLLVIGHRQNRQDNWSRRYASLMAKRFRKFILKDITPDSGCGIKVFSRNLFLSLPYFDHIHRFLPALTRRHGGSVISHIVSHRNRSSGVSKYSNWQRFRVGLIDLYGVSWLIKRSSFPIKLKDEEK